jgi:hypothetical protein
MMPNRQLPFFRTISVRAERCHAFAGVGSGRRGDLALTPWPSQTFSDRVRCTSLAEIKTAVRKLSPKELAELTAFISKENNAAWDAQMEKDAASGKLDFLFEEAERERAAGQLRDWPDKK